MDAQQIEARIKALESQVRKLEDIEEIKRLQKAYGYYLEHWMNDEIIDLFSDSNDLVLNGAEGGKPELRKYFKSLKDFSRNPEFLHQAMQLSGIVDVNPDGVTAEGRWYGYGKVALPAGKGVRPLSLDGIYTVEYVKEDGKWKIKKLIFHQIILAPPDEGWVKKERIAAITPHKPKKGAPPRKPLDSDARYPSGYIVPFHFKHPVTGEKTSEAKHNASLKRKQTIKPHSAGLMFKNSMMERTLFNRRVTH
jgi:hypothetical protein